MGRRSIYTKEMILNAAMEVFKKKGSDGVIAKNIAKELGCSVAPIYSVYMRLDDLKKDLNKLIRQSLFNKTFEKESEKKVDVLLYRMFRKLELSEDKNDEIKKEILIFKNSLIKGENRFNVFSNFSNIVSILSKTRDSNFSRSQIYSLIARHKKYITEFFYEK